MSSYPMVCQTLFEGQTVTWIDLSCPKEDVSDYEFGPEDVCVIAVPSFGGRVPAAASWRIGKLSAKGARAVVMAVYGNREFEDTLAELEDILTERGFICRAAVSAIAEHSIVRQYGTGRPDEKDQKELGEFGEQIRTYLAEDGKENWGENCRENYKENCEENCKENCKENWIPGNRPYKKLGTVPMIPQTDDSCIKCGICGEKCPAQAIPADRPWETDGEKCISCMRCLSICPVHARTLDSDRLAGLAERLKNVCAGRKENKVYYNPQKL